MADPVMLMDVRLSFPQIWHAKEFKQGDGKPRFDATFLIVPDSENDKKIRGAINKAALAAFDGNAAKAEQFIKTHAGQRQTFCYLDGNTQDYDGYAGHWYLACHRQLKDGRPKIFGLNPKAGELTEADGIPYAGCYVNAKIEIYVQTKGNPGVRASFSGIQFARDGDAFSGGAVATEDDFDNLAEGADAPAMF